MSLRSRAQTWGRPSEERRKHCRGDRWLWARNGGVWGSNRPRTLSALRHCFNMLQFLRSHAPVTVRGSHTTFLLRRRKVCGENGVGEHVWWSAVGGVVKPCRSHRTWPASLQMRDQDVGECVSPI